MLKKSRNVHHVQIKKIMKVINGDNIETLKEYPDNYFDLAIVDPPYGIGFDNKIRDKK